MGGGGEMGIFCIFLIFCKYFVLLIFCLSVFCLPNISESGEGEMGCAGTGKRIGVTHSFTFIYQLDFSENLSAGFVTEFQM